MQDPSEDILYDGIEDVSLNINHAWDHLQGLVEELCRYDITDKIFSHLEEIVTALSLPPSVLRPLSEAMDEE